LSLLIFQMALKKKSRAILALWDIENVCGTPDHIARFIWNFKQGIRIRFDADKDTPLRFRIQVFHNPAKPQLERKTSLDKAVKEELMEAGVTLVDIGSSKPQQADYCIKNRMSEILEDWDPKECIVVLISGDGGFIPQLRTLKNQGFECYMVCNFDCLASDIKKIDWLEIWSYYVISHGDFQKMSGQSVIRRGPHPKKATNHQYKFKYYRDETDKDFIFSSSGHPKHTLTSSGGSIKSHPPPPPQNNTPTLVSKAIKARRIIQTLSRMTYSDVVKRC